jgi:hypothetical protein
MSESIDHSPHQVLISNFELRAGDTLREIIDANGRPDPSVYDKWNGEKKFTTALMAYAVVERGLIVGSGMTEDDVQAMDDMYYELAGREVE